MNSLVPIENNVNIVETEQTVYTYDDKIELNAQLYREILDNIIDGAFIILGTKHVYGNQAGIKLLGLNNLSELIGTEVTDFVADKYKEIVRKRAYSRQSGLKTKSKYEIEILRKDGEKFIAEVHVSIINFYGKKASLSILRDISDRYAYRTKLQNLHKHATLIATAKSIQDIQSITYSTLNDVFGFNRGSFALVEGDELVHRYRWHRKKQIENRMPLNGPGVTVRAVKIGKTQLVNDTRKDPDYINANENRDNTLSELVVPIKIHDIVVAVINIESLELNKFTDDDVKLLETYAEHVSSALIRIKQEKKFKNIRDQHIKEMLEGVDKISSMVRHDLRSPLSSIKNATYFIRKNPKITEEMLNNIDKSVDYASKILEDLKHLTRAKKLERMKVNIDTMFLDWIKSTMVPDNIHIKSDFQEIEAYIDVIMIRRVFDNLVRNSIQAMPDGGDLILKLYKEDENMVIVIKDTGVGIPKEQQRYLFQPLFTTKVGGMGLGLAFTKQAIQLHGGTIYVESEKDKGATFTIKLPIITKLDET